MKKRLIYADNAATTKLDADAFAVMEHFLLDEYGNASQPYSFARPAKKALREARETIAACIGALPSEIYFTSGGTESDNWAIRGAVPSAGRRGIITSEIEHHGILRVCESMAEAGAPVSYLPVDGRGVVLLSVLSAHISAETALVSLMLANNELGTVEPVGALSDIAHRHGALFHTDAVQALGHIPVDVRSLGVDLLSGSAQKFNGPKGVGFLYVREGTPLRPLYLGGRQESGLRAGTENVPGIAAMAAALRKNCAEMKENAARLLRMEEDFLRVLREAGIDFIRNGAPEHIPGTIHISIRGASGEMLLHRLDLMGIAISTGSACDSVETQVSHVVRAIGVPEAYAKGSIRISFGRENDAEDAAAVASAIVRVVKKA